MPLYLPSEHDLLARYLADERALIQQALDLVGGLEDTEPSRPHGIDVALNLLVLNVDLDTILAAILSDYRLIDYPVSSQFGSVVASLVKNIKQLNALNIYSKNIATEASQVEILRRMLLSTADDIRALLIKLAYRLARLKKISQEEQSIRHFIAQETLDLYAPIANRLGVGQLKWQLEDYAFRYLDPKNYLHVAKSLESKRIHREECIARFINQLEQLLVASKMQVELKGRPKHIYSIWQKMQRKQLPIEELYDLLAVRVKVATKTDCYTVLGIVHQAWTFIPKEFDDYIAHPKNNGYQSLHTVILDADNNRIEIQIRTQEMDDFAELGVAAHWRYKEGGNQDRATEKSIASLRQLLEEKDSPTLLADFRTELFSDRVYVLTPKGQLLDLIKGATPLDFAYAIHTDVGHRCRGAKVNGCIVPLTYTLKTGEQVEILTSKDIQPKLKWIDLNLGYLKTPRAINKVKSWFALQEQDKVYLAGQQILEEAIKKIPTQQVYLTRLVKYFHLDNTKKLWRALGQHTINSRQLNRALQKLYRQNKKIAVKKISDKEPQRLTISVAETDNILTHFAGCCKPNKNDELIGFISQNNGIAIHKIDCENIKQLDDEQTQRLVKVSLH